MLQWHGTACTQYTMLRKNMLLQDYWMHWMVISYQANTEVILKGVQGEQEVQEVQG